MGKRVRILCLYTDNSKQGMEEEKDIFINKYKAGSGSIKDLDNHPELNDPYHAFCYKRIEKKGDILKTSWVNYSKIVICIQ